MAVLRMNSSFRAASSAVVLDLGDLKRQGDDLRANAQREALEIVDAARREHTLLVEGGREQGHALGQKEGFDQGYEKGLEEGRAAALLERRAELGNLEKAWQSNLAQFLIAREDLLERARLETVQLALEIARRVTRRALEHDPAVVTEQLRTALAAATSGSRLFIRVSTQDEQLAREALPGLLPTQNSSDHVELRGDPTLPAGSCLVGTSGGGEIDASIETQLDRIARALLNEEIL